MFKYLNSIISFGYPRVYRTLRPIIIIITIIITIIIIIIHF